MAAYMRSVFCLHSCERKAFLLGASSSSRLFVESKRYVRGLRRRPVKVLFTEDARSQSAPIQQTEKIGKGAKATITAARKIEGVFVEERKSVQAAVKDANKPLTKDEIAGLRFERAFPGDKRLARVVSVARSRTFREHQGKILLEGRRLICDALNAGASPQMVFFSSVDRLLELPVDKLKRATLVKVKFEDIKTWSDLVTPQGVIAIFSLPDASRLHYVNSNNSVPLSVICDNIRDPGNLGTILRCAVAAGCQSILLTKGCVDIWEPKVLRAAMGAHFHLPLYPNLHWEDIENHLPKSVIVHVADNSGDKLRETTEPKEETQNKPMTVRDYGWVSTRSSTQRGDHDGNESDSDSDYELSLPIVDTKIYYENWAHCPTALVIGGETHGLSVEAVQLAEKTAGHRLFIPVVPEVDSLNSAMAASILLFEGRKQLLQLIQSTMKSKSKVVNRFLVE